MIEISDIIKEPRFAFGVAAGAVIRRNYEYADNIFNRLLETYATNKEFSDTEADFKKGVVNFFFKPLLENGNFKDVIKYSEKMEILNEEWREFLRYIKSAAKMSHADKTEGEKTRQETIDNIFYSLQIEGRELVFDILTDTNRDFVKKYDVLFAGIQKR